MAFHFVMLSFVLIAIFFVGFSAGRGSGVKWARNLLDKDASDYLKHMREGEGSGLALLIYLAVCLAVMFVPSYIELRESYVKNYDDGKYIWVQPTKTVVQNDSTVYINKGNPYLKSAKELKKEIETGEFQLEK